MGKRGYDGTGRRLLATTKGEIIEFINFYLIKEENTFFKAFHQKCATHVNIYVTGIPYAPRINNDSFIKSNF